MPSTATTWASSTRTRIAFTSLLAENSLAESSRSPPTLMALSITGCGRCSRGLSDHERPARCYTVIAKPKPVSVSRNDAKHFPKRRCNGIVWAVENCSTAVLRAYDATNLATELYNSSQAAGGRDQFSGNKFITP